MLTQLVDETFAIADSEATLRLKFMENCRYGRGLFTENSFILVEGEMTEEEAFNVHSITLPPYESRKQTEACYEHANWLGSQAVTMSSTVLNALSAEFSEVSMVLISDVHLDNPVVFQGLKKLFATLETKDTPLAVVMMGSFTSKPFSAKGESADAYTDGFKKLGNLISEFSNLSKWCRFIMVPGPNDPVHIHALPHAPLAKLYYEGLSSKVSNAIFTSNPARIQIADKHIVLMRHNLLNKVLRNVAIPLPLKAASNPVTIQKYYVRTVIDSGHLVPLPLNAQPILLARDNALRLHCNPHLLVLSDETPAFSTDYKDTKFVNPGAFIPVSPSHSINYFTYLPFQDILEQRYLPIDD
ncbi:DNA-directed DNA polymerase epsilon, subunit B [Entomophthora muscae]|uniref:DNA-directed DNA polymerase epsilon, subunit B n=1 Tax=Entomophthora muscae TaxID=34485 RepID=A0ACC2SUC1_9FUNG|nr:DNA-directed DNA polymerase epsilon, subunit B [Entomophthora muscae]